MSQIIVQEIQDEQLQAFDFVYLQKLRKELGDKKEVLELNLAKIDKQIYFKRKQEFKNEQDVSLLSEKQEIRVEKV